MVKSDINHLYRRVLKSNERLQKLKRLGAPAVIINNEHRIFESAVRELMTDEDIGRFAEDIGPHAFGVCFDHIAGTPVARPNEATPFGSFAGTFE